MSWFLDGLAFLYMLLNGTLGFTRGLVDELGRLIGLAISILVAISQTVNISNLILDKIDLEPWLAVFIAFSGVFSVILISSRLITRLFQIALLSKANIWLNSLLGFLFGVLKGFCIITVFVWLLIILPLDKWTNIIEQNSKIFQTTTSFRSSIVNFFGWEDPINYSENFIKDLVQP
ncbi:MAG: CvpA family protein [Candidatus Neomarinimicrobiota bacterium]|nr:CvpA family protein [Candidatus Neomarinimicrobiota bacterium]